MQPLYDINKSYDWNYRHGPVFSDQYPVRDVPSSPGYSFLGNDIFTPIGVPAGPVLHSEFVKCYARLGFDVIVYKTVRTLHVPSHPLPNCLYLDNDSLDGDRLGCDIQVRSDIPKNINDITITNSFGVPSKSPDNWQADVAKSLSYMKKGQLLIVSIMGTIQPQKAIITDYVEAACLAKDAGARCIEVNYSCPNLCDAGGVIYKDPVLSSQLSQAIKKAIGDIPLIMKIGYIDDDCLLEEIVTQNAPYVEAISAINTIQMQVKNVDNQPALSTQRLKSGVCGKAIHNLACDMVKKLTALKNKHLFDYEIIGVGGAMNEDDLQGFLGIGSSVAMTATAAMWDPLLAWRWWDKYS